MSYFDNMVKPCLLDRLRVQQPTIPADYILAYDFNGNVLDKSTKLNHGILDGNYTFESVTDANNKTLNGITFNNGVVETSKNLFEGIDTNKVSLSLWAKTTQTSQFILAELSPNYNPFLNAFLLYTVTRNIALSQRMIDPGIYHSIIDGRINDGLWYHIVITSDKDLPANVMGNIYINGAPVSVTNSSEKNTLNYNKTVPLFIGRRNPSTLPYIGSVSKFKVYPRIITEEEVTQLYNEL